MSSVQLLRGNDPTLLSDAIARVVDDLVGDEDRTLAVAELTEADYKVGDGYTLAPVADAAQTPPFLTSVRVVIARDLGRYGKMEQLAPVLEYLSDPLPTTALVLIWEKPDGYTGRFTATAPKKLTEAVAAAGGESTSVSTPSGRGVTEWLRAHVDESPVELDGGAVRYLADQLGEDLARVGTLLTTLASAHPDGAALGVDDVAPYLGEAGSVPPWELTDAMAKGDIAVALDRLGRMMAGGERHALQILGSFHAHYGRMLALDGSGISDEKAAAELLGMKGSTFPAKKALAQTRRMGSARIARAIALLAQADLDVRGATAADGRTVIEVLTARLTQLSRS